MGAEAVTADDRSVQIPERIFLLRLQGQTASLVPPEPYVELTPATIPLPFFPDRDSECKYYGTYEDELGSGYFVREYLLRVRAAFRSPTGDLFFWVELRKNARDQHPRVILLRQSDLLVLANKIQKRHGDCNDICEAYRFYPEDGSFLFLNTLDGVTSSMPRQNYL